MKRKEEIKQAGLYYANNLDDIKPNDEFTKNLCIALGQAYIKGAEWADETMLNKVCEWLEDNIYDYLYINRDFNEADYKNELIEDLRKAIEQ